MPDLRILIYPQLRRFGAEEREAVLRAARDAPFDVIELGGIAFGLVVAASLTRLVVEAGTLDRIVTALASFFVAAPLLVALVGPFFVRHVRRGLDRELDSRGAG